MADLRLRQPPTKFCAAQERFTFASIHEARHGEARSPIAKWRGSPSSTRWRAALWEALRAWRLEEARRQELPPYVIFHDSTLLEVARQRPISLMSLAKIPGVGASKLERYGSAIIGMVAQMTLGPAALYAASPINNSARRDERATLRALPRVLGSHGAVLHSAVIRVVFGESVSPRETMLCVRS